jgi:hypothetical protein
VFRLPPPSHPYPLPRSHRSFMISIRFVPIDRWPGVVPKVVVTSPFSAPYPKTLALLDRELRSISAQGVVLQAFFRPDQIRNDGVPYASANPQRSGVILSFRTQGKGALSFPCWKYVGWEDNVRAIALSLEALRAVDRYGVTQHAEQYQGWKQIEAPLPGGFRGKEDAAAFLATQAEDHPDPDSLAAIIRDAVARKRFYRDAAAKLHPDASGDHELFVRLQQAMAILEGKK